VRLLGVRLAAFEDEGEPEAAPERSPQLTLPLGRQRVVSTPP